LSKAFGLYAKQSDPQNRAGLFARSVNIVADATMLSLGSMDSRPALMVRSEPARSAGKRLEPWGRHRGHLALRDAPLRRAPQGEVGRERGSLPQLSRRIADEQKQQQRWHIDCT
jgi:hypothetical protein